MLTTRPAIARLVPSIRHLVPAFIAMTTAMTTTPASATSTVVPTPAAMQRHAGRLTLDSGLALPHDGDLTPRLQRALERFAARLERKTGILSLRGERLASSSPLVIVVGDAVGGDPIRQDESYRIEIDAKGARLEAATETGALRGLETLLQLAYVDGSGWALPAVSIEDRPRYAWRGLLIDPARHWLPPEDIRRTLDAMAMVKLNVLHWHLTDDQGFRLQSLRYPELYGEGSDGRFYSRLDIGEIVAYAADRGIRVVPEIDMPGHVGSWLVSHPEVAAAQGPHRPLRTFGVQEAVLDPIRSETWELVAGVLAEVAELFPDPVIHVGGDEVTGKWWKENRHIATFMTEHALVDVAALQDLFTRRVADILANSHRRLMGWSEIQRADLPHDPIIQVWRDTESLREGTTHGYDTVFSWGYYLDHMFPASFYYRIDPLDFADDLDDEARRRILGGEACLWGELVTPEILDAHLWPAAAAVAERLWSPRQALSAETLDARLAVLVQELRLVGVDPGSKLEAMRRRLVREGEPATLEVFAETLQPPRYYLRHGLRQADQLTSLNLFTDSLAPESDAARAFAADVEDYLTRGDDEARERARAALERWRANAAGLHRTLRGSPLLHQLLPLAESVDAVVHAGLEALERLDGEQHLDSSWRAAALAAVDAVPHPDTQVMRSILAGTAEGEDLWSRLGAQVRRRRGKPVADVAIAPAVRKLVEATAGATMRR